MLFQIALHGGYANGRGIVTTREAMAAAIAATVDSDYALRMFLPIIVKGRKCKVIYEFHEPTSSAFYLGNVWEPEEG